MDALLGAIADIMRTLFSDQRNIAITVSAAFNVALSWAHIVWRREERQDREKMVETFSDVTKALNGLRNVLSAATGKPQ